MIRQIQAKRRIKIVKNLIEVEGIIIKNYFQKISNSN